MNRTQFFSIRTSSLLAPLRSCIGPLHRCRLGRRGCLGRRCDCGHADDLCLRDGRQIFRSHRRLCPAVGPEHRHQAALGSSRRSRSRRCRSCKRGLLLCEELQGDRTVACNSDTFGVRETAPQTEKASLTLARNLYQGLPLGILRVQAAACGKELAQLADVLRHDGLEHRFDQQLLQ